MENDELVYGSGVEVFGFDLRNKTYSVEFDLVDETFEKHKEISYLNPATTFRFIASGYYLNYILIRDEIERLFDDNKQYTRIPHLIFPLFFSFRHFVELKMKSLFFDIFKRKPKKLTHDLLTLVKDMRRELIELDGKSLRSDFVKETHSNLDSLESCLKEYIQIEPKTDFYRFYLDKDLKVEKLRVELEFDVHTDIMNRITVEVSELYKKTLTLQK